MGDRDVLSKVVRSGHREVALLARRVGRSPFRSEAGRALLVHCAHHKIGTVWFKSILGGVARRFGMRLRVCSDEHAERRAEILLYRHSRHFDRRELGSRVLRGTHMIRDPRDVVVSGYFYHLWTAEAWAHEPRERLGGLSYQAYLNSLSRDEGLAAEIRWAAEWTIAEMAGWKYDQPDFLELRYEDLVENEADSFIQIFQHYGFDDWAIEQCLDVVQRRSFGSITGRALGDAEPRQHLRSGKVGEWRELFTEEHRGLFKQVAGETLIALGYERDDDWRC